MSWAPVKSTFAKAADDVSMALRKQKSSEDQFWMHVYLSAGALAALGAAIGNHIRVERGTAEHLGQLRLSLSRSVEGRALASAGGRNKKRVQLIFKAWPESARQMQTSTKCQWRVAGKNMIEITLPPWADTRRAATVTPIIPGTFARRARA